MSPVAIILACGVIGSVALAGYLASRGTRGWGWFLFIAFILAGAAIEA